MTTETLRALSSSEIDEILRVMEDYAMDIEAKPQWPLHRVTRIGKVAKPRALKDYREITSLGKLERLYLSLFIYVT